VPFEPHVEQAARIIRAGGVVAYPTEAVFGLGCLPEDRKAVERLLAIKRRSWRKGLLLIGASLEQLERYALVEGSPCRAAILEGWPGPVTWVLPATSAAPMWITGGRHSIAVRLTAHSTAAALCSAVGGALVSTSANLSRHSPARSALRVRRQLGGKVDYVLHGQVGELARPTAIRDGRTGSILRPA
jgi:L-threonylcarbamoyladenylate synthase